MVEEGLSTSCEGGLRMSQMQVGLEVYSSDQCGWAEPKYSLTKQRDDFRQDTVCTQQIITYV